MLSTSMTACLLPVSNQVETYYELRLTTVAMSDSASHSAVNMLINLSDQTVSMEPR